jgi:protein-S-isoprenylcysteine O-methyltransferase Ste14
MDQHVEGEGVMKFRARLRAADWSFWVPFATTVIALFFVVMSIVDPQWIEGLFGESPDAGSGEAEWWITALAVGVAAAALAVTRWRWRCIRVA